MRVSALLVSIFCAHGRMSLPSRSLYSHTFSPTVKSSMINGSWCIINTPACSASAALRTGCGCPVMVISPSVRVSTPASSFAKVDLPAPLAPQTPSTLPA